MSVYVEEVYTKLDLDDGGLIGQRDFIMAWTDVGDFMAQMYGAYQQSNGQVIVSTPATWPGIPYLGVRGLHAEPQDPESPYGNQSQTGVNDNAVADFTLPTWQGQPGSKNCGARVSAIYRAIPPNGTPDGKPDVPSGTFLEFESDSSETAISIPGRNMYYGNGFTTPIPQDITVPLPINTEDLRLVWHRVTKPPFTAMRKLKGTVNENLFCNHSQGYVRYVGSQVRYEFQIAATILYTVAHHFRVMEAPGTQTNKTFGHNAFYIGDASGEKWNVIADKSGKAIFPYDTDLTDNGFDDLFAYDTP